MRSLSRSLALAFLAAGFAAAAAASLGAKRKGKTPLLVTDLPIGRYRVVATSPGYAPRQVELVVEDRTIELKNPIGMTLKTFVIDSPADLEIQGRKLFITSHGQKKKISGLMANGAQWRELTQAIHKAKG